MLINSRTHLVVSTDLEPDDILALSRLFAELSANRVWPSIQIIVGEGNAPNARMMKVRQMIQAAADDKLLPRSYAASIDVLPGSSSRSDKEVVHHHYNREFFGQETPEVLDVATIEKSRKRIVATIAGAKKARRNVVFMEFKPVNDSIPILAACRGVLTHDDALLLSGSFNIRRFLEEHSANREAATADVERMINGSDYQTTVFEGHFAYERSGLPKDIMRYPEDGDASRTALTELAERISNDDSNLGRIHSEASRVWNRGVSYDCATSCADIVLKAFRDNRSGIANYEALETLRREALDEFFCGRPIDELNKEFIAEFNRTVFGEVVLTGEERTAADYPDRLTSMFATGQLPSFGRNWKILGVIATDPKQGLIGDASVIAHAFHDGIYELTQCAISYDEKGHACLSDETRDAKSQGSTSMITGVADFGKLVAALGPPAPELEVGTPGSDSASKTITEPRREPTSTRPPTRGRVLTLHTRATDGWSARGVSTNPPSILAYGLAAVDDTGPADNTVERVQELDTTTDSGHPDSGLAMQ